MEMLLLLQGGCGICVGLNFWAERFLEELGFFMFVNVG
jgi:hypothetical protein